MILSRSIRLDFLQVEFSVTVRAVSSFESRKIDRRSLLLGGFAGAIAAKFGVAQSPRIETSLLETPRLETLTQWLNASRSQREDGVQQCLARIREMDPSIHAWVQVSPQKSTGEGKLDGIPFGAKDIIETKGLATEYGSEIYKGRIGTKDAAIIRELRERGAILLGKTVTAAFAYFTPGPTRNPRDLEHTPGGSSSGSAAAVAAGMVPFTIGEQTVGSILRRLPVNALTGEVKCGVRICDTCILKTSIMGETPRTK